MTQMIKSLTTLHDYIENAQDEAYKSINQSHKIFLPLLSLL